ncbi:MAG: hypothetical protein MUC95_00260 [Spirochaetes bacterium]|nr:hypothetical protein [Spirochaetota bacterium]
MTDATGFTITVNGSGATIINTSTGSGSYLMIFTPAEPVAEGDTVAISYDSAAGGDARDYDDNDLESFDPVPVINLIGAFLF